MHELLEEVRLRSQLPRPEEARAVRVRARISRKRFAVELGVSEITIYRWEQGMNRPRGRSAAEYAKLLEALRQVAVA